MTRRKATGADQKKNEPNHPGFTAQSLFFLEEESCKVNAVTLKRSQTSQTTSKEFSSFKNVLPASPNKRLQLKLTNNPQNSYQISSQHHVPETWVKQHPKTPKTTKTNENPSPSSSMHKLVPFGSKLVPILFLQVPIGSKVHRSVPTNLKLFPNCSHAHALFQDGFKDVQVGSRWFSAAELLRSVSKVAGVWTLSWCLESHVYEIWRQVCQ